MQPETQPSQLPEIKPAAPLSSLRVLVLLCIGIPLLAYAAVGIQRYLQISEETEVRVDRSLRVAHEHALKVLDTNETLLARVLDALGDADAAAIHANEKQLHDQLRAMSLNKPQIQSVWVQSSEGKPLVADRFYPVPQADFSDRDYFKWHQQKHGGLYVSEALIGRVTKSLFFDLSLGRYKADGSFDGLVSISMLPSYFEKFYDDMAADEPGLAVSMVRADGTILARWPPRPGSPAKLAPDSPVMTRIRNGETYGVTRGVSSVDGRERLLMYRKVGEYPIYVGTGMELSQIRQRWLSEMGWLAAFGLPPLLGLFLAARVALRRTGDALESAARLQQETQTRRRVEEALLQAQKLEALGRLTGGVAHDFNNALMVISNNLFLLQRKHPDAGGPQLASIGRAVSSATKLTRQLLAFSRRQALVPEHVRLHERLPAMQDLLGPVLGSQVQLSITVEDGTAPILVDSAEFELALINLAINARDAMPSGGSFGVSARNAGPALPGLLHGPMVVVEARDTGSGIAPELLDKVFEPFFTTKPVGEGTGLGLSQVYGLCQRAGGTATVESRPGLGTSVRLFFPAAAPQAAGTPLAAAPAQRSLGKRLLLVEDNDEVAAALVPVLEAMDCSVTRLDRAAAARDWLAAQASLPDVLLTDVVMPGEMDGVALARHARQAWPQLGIVVMTGYAEQLESIARLGFEIVPKPCSPDLLADAIERVTRPAGTATAGR